MVTLQGGLVGDIKLTENSQKLFHSSSFGNVSARKPKPHFSEKLN
jgi:hypothetical protein